MNYSWIIDDFKKEVFFGFEFEKEEIPSFSSIYKIKNNKPEKIFTASNLVKITNDTTSHSEIIVIKESQKILKTRYLNECILITTLEPCLMCTGALIGARIDTVIYLSEQSRHPGISSMSLEMIYKQNHFPKILYYEDETIKKKFKTFFMGKRELKK